MVPRATWPQSVVRRGSGGAGTHRTHIPMKIKDRKPSGFLSYLKGFPALTVQVLTASFACGFSRVERIIWPPYGQGEISKDNFFLLPFYIFIFEDGIGNKMDTLGLPRFV